MWYTLNELECRFFSCFVWMCSYRSQCIQYTQYASISVCSTVQPSEMKKRNMKTEKMKNTFSILHSMLLQEAPGIRHKINEHYWKSYAQILKRKCMKRLNTKWIKNITHWREKMDNKILLFTSEIFKWSFSLHSSFLFSFILHSAVALFYSRSSIPLCPSANGADILLWPSTNEMFERNSIEFGSHRHKLVCDVAAVFRYIHSTVFVYFANENCCVWYWRFSLVCSILVEFVCSPFVRLCVKSIFNSSFFPIRSEHIQFHDYWFCVFPIWSQKIIFLHRSSHLLIFHSNIIRTLYLVICLFCVQWTNARYTMSEEDAFPFFSTSFYSICWWKRKRKNERERATGLKNTSSLMGRFSFLKLEHSWINGIWQTKYLNIDGGPSRAVENCLTMMEPNVSWMCCLFDKVYAEYLFYSFHQFRAAIWFELLDGCCLLINDLVNDTTIIYRIYHEIIFEKLLLFSHNIIFL